MALFCSSSTAMPSLASCTIGAEKRAPPREGRSPKNAGHKRQSNFIAGEDIPQRHHHAVKGSALAQLNLKAHHEVQTKKQIPSSLHCQRFSERNPKLFKGSRLKEPINRPPLKIAGPIRTLKRRSTTMRIIAAITTRKTEFILGLRAAGRGP